MAKCHPSRGFKTGPTDPQRAVILRYLQYKTICVFESISVAPLFGFEHTHTLYVHTYGIHTYKFDALMIILCKMTISDQSKCQVPPSVPISATRRPFRGISS